MDLADGAGTGRVRKPRIRIRARKALQKLSQALGSPAKDARHFGNSQPDVQNQPGHNAMRCGVIRDTIKSCGRRKEGGVT